MNGKKLAKSEASFVVFRRAKVGVAAVIQVGRGFWGAECLDEVGSFASGSVSGLVLGRGKKACETISPAAAVIDGYSLVPGGGRGRRFMATGLMARKAWANAPAPSTAE